MHALNIWIYVPKKDLKDKYWNVNFGEVICACVFCALWKFTSGSLYYFYRKKNCQLNLRILLGSTSQFLQSMFNSYLGTKDYLAERFCSQIDVDNMAFFVL